MSTFEEELLRLKTALEGEFSKVTDDMVMTVFNLLSQRETYPMSEEVANNPELRRIYISEIMKMACPIGVYRIGLHNMGILRSCCKTIKSVEEDICNNCPERRGCKYPCR